MFKSILLGMMLMVSGHGMQMEHDHASHAAAEAQESVEASGVVKAIVKEEKTIRIFHDPIPLLRWPAMTMVFDVSDPAMMEGISVGDRISFQFTRNGSKNTIVKIMR